VKNLQKVGVYVIFRQRLLLIREKSDGHHSYRWNIVKGSVESKDKTFEDAVRRESREEVGLKLANMRLFYTSYRRRRVQPVIQVHYIAQSKSGIPIMAKRKQQELLNEDIVDARFFTKQQLMRIPRQELMNDRVWRGIRRWIQEIDA
jgi:8-oxo-dGTP pyrophosphatase MutT (NUDIX family)